MLTIKEKLNIQEALGLENVSINKMHFDMSYVGMIQSAEIFVKLTDTRASIQIHIGREFSNESIYEIINFALGYYYNNLQLFKIKKGTLVASLQNCDMYMYIEKDDLYYVLQNIKQSLLQVTCKKYKRVKICICDTKQGCVYRQLLFRNTASSMVILTAMPQVAIINLLETIMPKLKDNKQR